MARRKKVVTTMKCMKKSALDVDQARHFRNGFLDHSGVLGQNYAPGSSLLQSASCNARDLQEVLSNPTKP